MAREIKETAHLHTDKKKFDKNFDSIFGKTKCENEECEYYHYSRLNGCTELKEIKDCEERK